VKTLVDGVKVTDAALTQIVVRAAEQVDGVRVRRPRRHLDVELGDGAARVELEVSVSFGRVLPDVARAVQERVAAALGTMCDVSVTAVDVSIEDLS
jgi:uncharacterized alkaline shock family protein YloU